MILGTVTPSNDAVVTLRIRGPSGVAQSIQVIVDTGFNNYLTLSPALIQDLQLPFRENARCFLADNSNAVTRLFTAHAEWLGRWRKILVIEMNGGPLLGMSMMNGCHPDIDVVDGGRVQIDRLKSAAD